MKTSFLLVFISLFVTHSWSQCEDFEMTLTAHHPTCTDYTDGRVEISTSGGMGEITYTILDSTGDDYIAIPGGTENILDNGCYFVTAIDELGCELVDSVCLVDPLSITADIVITNPTFPGACDGVVAAESVAGYQAPFDLIVYYWTIPDAPDSDEVVDVCAGEYTLVINDVNGCTGIFDFALGSLAETLSNAIDKIEVYTNHTDGSLIVKNNPLNNATIKVFNLAGQVVFEKEMNSENTILKPNLKHGVYVYAFESSQQRVQTGKLVF